MEIRSMLCKVSGKIMLALTLSAGLASAPVEASGIKYLFDFGAVAVEPGYLGVSAAEAYDPGKGYGFNTPENMRDVAASGTGAGSDAVRFLTSGTKSTNTFNVDLPNGLYEVQTTLGNIARASVAAEGVYQVLNILGNGATTKFQIPITDGQLNLLITAGKEGSAFTLSAMQIKKLSNRLVANPTIYLGGDSTVCDYYPLETNSTAGWGQMLPEFVNPKRFQIRNMAWRGQYAAGFRDEGPLETILQYIKPGDYFILQLGINDQTSKNKTSEAEFKETMREMVRLVKQKGGTVVLSTPQGKANDFNAENIHNAENRFYRQATMALAQEENVALVDLNVISSAYFTAIGPEATKALYLEDNLHFTRAGAYELARLVSGELKRQGLPGFAHQYGVLEHGSDADED